MEENAELEDLVEKRLSVIRKGWQKQALEKIQQAEKDAFERGKSSAATQSTAIVEEAEQRGYKNGKKSSDDEVRKWRAIAEAYLPANDGSGSSNSSDHTHLIKYIMEQVYREVKREFPSEDETSSDVVTRMKKVLIASNEVLMKKLPTMTMTTSSKAASTPTCAPAPAPLVATRHNNPMANLSVVSAIQRAYKFCLNSVATPLTFLADVDISGVEEHAKPKSLFGLSGDGTYVNYCISVKLHFIDKNGTSSRPVSYFQQRRHSEFQALQKELRREFPRAVVPPLLTATVIEQSGNSDNKIDRRRRMLGLWLQYVYHHGLLQRSASLLAFVSGGGKQTERDSLGMYRGSKANDQYSSKRAPADSGSRVLSAVAEAATRAKVAWLSPVQPPQEVYSSVQFARELALRDMQTIHCHMSQVEIHFVHVTDASRRLRNAFQESSTLFYGASHACNVMSTIEEKHGGCESSAWKEMSKSLSSIAPLQTLAAQSLHNSVVETFSLFSASIPGTKLVLDSGKASMAVSSLDESEKLEIAVGVAAEWDAAKRIRSSLLLDRLSELCSDMADLHSKTISRWEESKRLLESFDPNMDEEIKKGSENLRMIISEEMGGLGSTLTSLQEKFTEKQDMQDAFVKITSALRRTSGGMDNRDSLSHDAILKRPVVPAGSRREPTPAELNAGIREQHVVKPQNRSSSSIFDRDSQYDNDDNDRELFASSAPAANGIWDGLEADQADEDDASPPPPPPKKASFGWTELWGGRSQSQQPVEPTRTAGSRTHFGRPSDADEDMRDSFSKSNLSSSVGATSFLNSDENGLGEIYDEDTPMNRAYQQREEMWAKKRAEDESKREFGATDEIYERRTRRAAPHTGNSGARRNKAKQVMSAPSDVYVPSPKPAPALRPAHGNMADQSATYFKQAPSSIPVPSRQQTSVSSKQSQQTQQLPSDDLDVNDLPPVGPSAAAPAATNQNFVNSSSVHRQSHHNLSGDPLPDGWEAVETSDGSVYYYHKVTRISRWDYPSPEVQAALEERLRESQRQQEEAIQKRKLERETVRRAQEEQSQVADRMQATIRKTILQWKQPTGPGKPRPFYDLLNTLHTIATVVSAGDVVKSPLTSASKPVEIKRAYFAAAKMLHPDKLTSEIPIEQRIMAEAAFVVLAEAWEQERS